MTRYEQEVAKVTQRQREAGWNEEDITWYIGFQRNMLKLAGIDIDNEDLPEGVYLGASLS